MEKHVIISGFGGQGIVFSGKLLAEAAMRSSLCTTYFPSYGVAMRGGAAKCDVIIAEDEIGSPVIDEADIMVAMSIEAERKYKSLIKKGGILVYNSSLISDDPGGEGFTAVPVPATDIAKEIGNVIAATLICLGYAARQIGGISCESFHDSLEDKVSKMGRTMADLNKKAVSRG
jgi:2-oxoglutarate ferredoxin oxidoreductase subunit gamma